MERLCASEDEWAFVIAFVIHKGLELAEKRGNVLELVENDYGSFSAWAALIVNDSPGNQAAI